MQTFQSSIMANMEIWYGNPQIIFLLKALWQRERSLTSPLTYLHQPNGKMKYENSKLILRQRKDKEPFQGSFAGICKNAELQYIWKVNMQQCLMSAHVVELLWHLSCLFGRVGVLSSSFWSLLLAAAQARMAVWLETEVTNGTVARLWPLGA